jgi:hypothetical protein
MPDCCVAVSCCCALLLPLLLLSAAVLCPVQVVAGFAENQQYGLGTNSMTGEQKSLLIYGALAVFFIMFLAGACGLQECLQCVFWSFWLPCICWRLMQLWGTMRSGSCGTGTCGDPSLCSIAQALLAVEPAWVLGTYGLQVLPWLWHQDHIQRKQICGALRGIVGSGGLEVVVVVVWVFGASCCDGSRDEGRARSGGKGAHARLWSRPR